MFCRYCGTQIQDGAQFCSHCGKPVDAAPPSQKKPSKNSSGKKKSVVLVVIALVLVLIITCVVAITILDAADKLEKILPQDIQATEPATEPPTEPPTEATVDPIPVPVDNPYRECYDESKEFILAESNIRYYAPSELQNLMDAAIKVAHGEVYARLGVAPEDPKLQEYFGYLSWYKPDAVEIELNTYEKENLFLLETCLRQRDGSLYDSGNPYMEYSNALTTYILPDSDSEYVTGDELYQLTEVELNIARNEIYARHGYIFEERELREYFCCESWYKPSVLADDFDSDEFSDEESGNIKLIKVYEDIVDGVTMSPSNRFYYYYNPNREFIFYNSSSRTLRNGDIAHLNVEQLIIARNEIFARNGYCFTDDELMDYFLQYSWYRPQVPPGRLDLISLNSTERANVMFLLEYQDYLEELQDYYGGYYGW